MAKVIITNRLEEAINKQFKGESVKVFELLLTSEDNPKKGKSITSIGGYCPQRAKIWGVSVLLYYRRIPSEVS